MKIPSIMAFAFAIVVGCQEPAPGPTVMSRDSAGITIHEYPADWVIPEWRLASAPEVRIGVVEGDPRYQFDRIVAGIRDDDGRIVVLDQAARRVVVFGADGEYHGESGRQGQGPGEYENPIALWRLPADSLAVYDPRVGISVLSESAEWARLVSLRPMSPNYGHGAFSNGALLFVDSNPDLNSFALADYWTVSPAGLDSIGRFRHIENMEPGSLMEVGNRPLPLISQFRYVGAGGDFMFTARNFFHEVEIRDMAAEIRRLVRWHGPDLSVTPEDAEAFKRSILKNQPESRRVEHERTLDAQVVPETHPAFQGIEVDQMGRGWFEPWRMPHEDGPSNWIVVAPDGELVAQIAMPQDIEVLDISDEHVLVRLTDDLNVQYVAVYRIERPDGS